MRGPYYGVGALDLPWPLSFAKEPEPDLDLEVDEPGAAGRPSAFGSPAPQKPPRLRILILILLLLIVAGGAYFAMDPEIVMKLTGQEESLPAGAKPPVTATRSPVSPAPSALPRPMTPESVDSTPAPGDVPAPAFGEGQRVSVVPNSATPGMSLALSQDAAGTKPGPTVRPEGTLLVMDAELHDRTWVYLVRTEEGAKGWIPEKQLAMAP